MILSIYLKNCGDLSGDLLEFVKQKGVYPYEHMHIFQKCSDDKLPDRSTFFSFLKNECISEKYYLHAIDVWNMLKRKTVGDFHDFYLKTGVLLLADVF